MAEDGGAIRPTVLIVEDEAVIRLATADALEQAGFSTVEAEDATAALAYLDAGGALDAIVTDVRMPGPIDGLALAAIVSRRCPEAAIIVTSGHARPEPHELPPQAKFLAKPYVMSVLAAALWIALKVAN